MNHNNIWARAQASTEHTGLPTISTWIFRFVILNCFQCSNFRFWLSFSLIKFLCKPLHSQIWLSKNAIRSLNFSIIAKSLCIISKFWISLISFSLCLNQQSSLPICNHNFYFLYTLKPSLYVSIFCASWSLFYCWRFSQTNHN